MGEAGRARILRDFSVDAMVAATLAVYTEARVMVRRAARTVSRSAPRTSRRRGADCLDSGARGAPEP